MSYIMFTYLIFRGRKLFICFFVLIFSICDLFSQDMPVLKGKVTDEKQMPLEGVNIYVKDNRTGNDSKIVTTLITDSNGNYSIEKLSIGKYIIHFSFLGYSSVEEEIIFRKKNIVLNIIMHKKNIELDEVIVKEDLSEIIRKEKSIPVLIIDQEFIKFNTSGSLMNTLGRLPGVSSMNIGSSVSKPMVRGLSFNRVVVAENGIKHEGQQWGVEHGLEIDQYNVHNIEIIKGPSSLLYGSDAIGGVVDIKPGGIPEKDLINSSILLTGKSVNNLLGISANINGREKDFFFRMNITAQDYGDLRVPADTVVYNTYNLILEDGYLKNTAGAEKNISLTSGIIKKWGKSSITITNVHHKTGFYADAHGQNLCTSNNIDYSKSHRDVYQPFHNVNHLKIVNNTRYYIKKNLFELNAGYQDNRHEERAIFHTHSSQPYPGHDREFFFNLKTWSVNARYYLRKFQRSEIVFGISDQLQYNDIDGYGYLVPSYTRNIAGIFLYDKYKLNKKLIINAGIRFDRCNLLIDQYIDDYTTNGIYVQRSPELERNYNNLSWSAGLSYDLTEDCNFKFNTGKSFRMPLPMELGSFGNNHVTFYFMKGDSTLSPEQSYQSDANLNYSKKRLSFDISSFVNYFSNYIFPFPTGEFNFEFGAGQIYQYKQSQIIRWGGEVTIEYLDLFNHFDLTVFGEYIYANQLDDDPSKRYPIPFTPPASLILNVKYKLPYLTNNIENTYISLDNQVYASQNRVVPNEPATEGYTIFDLIIGADLKIKNQQCKISFQINNILNTKYLNHLSFYRMLEMPEPGRNFQFKLLMPFNKKWNKKGAESLNYE